LFIARNADEANDVDDATSYFFNAVPADCAENSDSIQRELSAITSQRFLHRLSASLFRGAELARYCSATLGTQQVGRLLASLPTC